MVPVPQDELITIKQYVRETLARSGANEVLTYSFVHKNTLTRAGQDASHAFCLSNALSPDLQYYRLSLMSSLLEKVHMNLRAGYDQFALYEIGKVHFKGEMDANEPNVPNEDNHVALVIAYGDKQKPDGAAYFQARMYLEQITDSFDVQLRPMNQFDFSTDAWGAQLVSAYDPQRSALLVKDEQIYGVVGEFKQQVRRAFKLPGYIAGFEVHMELLHIHSKTYRPLSRFPSVTQDVSLVVNDAVAYADVYRLSHDALKHSSTRHYDLSPLGIYHANDSDTKTITLRLKVTDQQRTLTDADVAQHIVAITEATAELGAKQV